MAIHPTALIAADAQLAPDVEIGAYTRDRRGRRRSAPARWIGPHVVIDGPTTIGRDNQIFQFASIGAAPQDLKYKRRADAARDRRSQRLPRELHDQSRHDQGSAGHAHRQTTICSWPARTSGTTASIGSHCVFANYATLGGHVEIGDWVHMGGFAGVHQFCKVGAHAFIANNTAVTRDVPPFVMAVGRPAEPHSVNSEGSEAPRLHAGADPQHPRRVSRRCIARG